MRIFTMALALALTAAAGHSEAGAVRAEDPGAPAADFQDNPVAADWNGERGGLDIKMLSRSIVEGDFPDVFVFVSDGQEGEACLRRRGGRTKRGAV